MVSRSEASQSLERITSRTISERHAEPGISDRFPDAGKFDSRFRRVACRQGRSENAQSWSWPEQIESLHG